MIERVQSQTNFGSCLPIQIVLCDDFTIKKTWKKSYWVLKLRYSWGKFLKQNTKSHLNTFLNHSKFNSSILRQQLFETKLFQWLFEERRSKQFYQYFSSIQLKFIGKENPIWAGEDLIKKFCSQIELVWRQDIRTAQSINNGG